jgi:hypothetical protein
MAFKAVPAPKELAAFVAGVVRRIDVDTLHLALIFGQQCLECLQIIPPDNHVVALLRVVCVPLLQYPVRHLLVMVDNLVFPDPFKCWHVGVPRLCS